MKVGIPKGLLYCKYNDFLTVFFSELGAEVVTSEDTNKEILDEGVKYCVDEACLPVKIFHGHVSKLKEKCDIIVLPRIMQLYKNEYICPKFCGLPEMVLNSIDNMPPSITDPIYAFSKKSLYNWAKAAGKKITPNSFIVKNAFIKAYDKHLQSTSGIKDEGYDINVALIGHPYNIYDSYVNMNLVNKLNNLGIGVETMEFTQSLSIDLEIEQLFKKPFWTYLKENYGFAANVLKEKNVEGIIYVSSFNCGTDSVIIELIKNISGSFPFLTLKIDEHTGEAGLNTRIEAFADMLERRVHNESNIPTHG
ncbi:MAG: acyl-CoA dehydratase activase-related protein [Sedimentibacter saalensis]|jgi:predicted nucleotide-binding protein (sugar kinase/HSP70/actin superfamily)|uniref:acyl-CoA dehydratase activase-related protein n=1 Tax=Sedimentibacter saalensis TaxID=130788 RepID=UPI002B211689|nr:acyl-CoA dehydratase activase-related protein [Sedimentibacter saalensis]MEA5094334.1 acyl-CoA dehydratase activase-related protein [Sedimentibacter saalensis]